MNYINNNNTTFLIITYNPDDNIFDVIKVINKIGFNFIVVDNSESYDLNIDKLKKNNPNSQIILNKNIKGISGALNIGFQIALLNKFKYVITLDQDSLFNFNLIHCYNQIFEKYNNYNIGAVGVNNNIKYSTNLKYLETFQLINSGTIVNCEAYTIVNGYDEKFFIDNVDFDFFLRINQNEYKTFKILNYGIDHKFGSPLDLNYFFIKIKFAKYPATRLYHFTYSNIYFFKKYMLVKPFFCIKKLFFFNLYMFHSLFVYNKMELKAMLMGVKNSFKN